ncbi:tetratricopeptide repeat protein [Corynebacterium sp. sy017]|uniref:tetratricopeptide repeat protein n=2 Tax=Corynebacterium TaxID=1716 RepID=UPI0011846D63|nr:MULTISPECIES: tetratricopeptide repeat protein [unclassified Corynebacterium]MBP3087548.1 tetratricopeptide repeat protein [Corynebacterium sp. sy017]QDZ42553.1 tetratricopeptide repeat protein [Corynebacterium sp. sy039]TSD92126.1 tetratricopeptide repeat protein [Corynebacterium sp. SY003]
MPEYNSHRYTRSGDKKSESTSRNKQHHGDRHEKSDVERPSRYQRHNDQNSKQRDDEKHSRYAGSKRRTRHSQRGGKGRDNFHGPHRAGYRDERIAKRQNEPDLPGDIDIKDLDPLVLQDLRVLSKDNADIVAKHLIMAATLLVDDPQLALRHARAAKDRAGRVGVVRETAGIAAYHAGEWKEALSELRAARRMGNGPGLVAVMADCERGLGRPEKAIEIAREQDQSQLDLETKIELAIVSAGARQDLGQYDSALATLERAPLSARRTGISYARLSYAYADALVAAGRIEQAREWFRNANKQDIDGLLDASERLEELQ